MMTAHRWVYEFAYGVTLAPDVDACHSCDNPVCVNVNHIFPGTRKENMDDMVSKGRSSRGKARPTMQGASHPNACLDEEQVRDIRSRHGSGESKRALSDAFGVSFQSISRIVRRISWSHIA